jgi:hypothetical protein
MTRTQFVLKFILISFAIIFIASCSTSRIISKVIPVETVTGSQQAVTVVQPAQTGNRDDVPVGWKPNDTIVIHQQGGAETYVNTSTGQVAQNAQAQTITEAVNKPKKSWAWLYWIIGVLSLLITGNIVLKAYFGVNPFGYLFGKLLKKT